MEVRRYDSVAIRAQTTVEGYLRDSPILGRTGVQEYRRADGTTRREYRSPDVVFHADALLGLRGIPIVDGHPGQVSSANVRQHVIGTVLSEGRQDGGNVVADIIIHDPAPVHAGKRELSLGYVVRLDETPGTSPEGEAYDAAVTAIVRMDHLAVVSRGRAGVARLNLDGTDATSINIEQEGGMPENLVTVRLDSITYNAPPEVAQHITRIEADLATVLTRADTAEAARDAAVARADASDASVVAARADGAVQARARLVLEAEAGRVGATFAEDASDRAIREAIIAKVQGPALRLDGKSDDYVLAACDLALASAVRADGHAADQVRQATPKPAASVPVMSAASARDVMIRNQTR